MVPGASGARRSVPDSVGWPSSSSGSGPGGLGCSLGGGAERGLPREQEKRHHLEMLSLPLTLQVEDPGGLC